MCDQKLSKYFYELEETLDLIHKHNHTSSLLSQNIHKLSPIPSCLFLLVTSVGKIVHLVSEISPKDTNSAQRGL